MTHIVQGSAGAEKTRRLRKIGLDVSCYVCGDRPGTVWANRALDGRIFFACERCKDSVV